MTSKPVELPKKTMLEKITGWRKLIVLAISLALVVLNRKLQLGIDDTVEKWLAITVSGYMVGNGLEHISDGIAAKANDKA